MNCDGCGYVNAPAARFCAECGTALVQECPACNAEQAPGAKFCDQCGASLVSHPVGAPTSGPSRSSAVRKHVTALFADLVGSTAFGERVDPEAARAALAPYFEILRSTVEDHAGTVVKFTGDGVLAVFGLPEVAEDDARRAIAVGQDLQRRFGAFAESVRDRHGVELGLRVGVNSGELVVGEGDEDLVGDVLNTAARLEAACAPGRVLVGEDTWRLTRSTVRYEVLGEISVKGKADPIATFQVAELPDAAIEEHIPFVGRDTELAQLLDAFAEARDSPVLRLVTVVGDPGVGKTRLASEVRGATSARSFDLRFERRGSTTFGPIADLLRLVTDGTADGVARLLDGHHERDRLLPILQSMLGYEGARSTEESFWGVRRLLEHLAEHHGPLLVVVDDIQWAEPLFWDLLDHLVEWTEAPVLVIALARPELRELRPELAQAGRRVAASIALDGLGADDTRELAARLLDVDEVPGDLIDRIPASTDGNPLFVRELVNMLVDDGTLERDGDRWRLTIDADAIDVPPTIISLLASRVERLPEDELRAIELASVIGTDFDRGTLAAISSDDGSGGPLGVVLDRLRRRDLVEPSGAWSGDHPVYRFHHVLVRDAAYRRLLKERRATLHELVGRHADQHHPEGDETDVVVAHHFEQVVRYRRDLGTVDAATDELAGAAVARLRRAADSALAREDLPAAGSAARRALDLVDHSAERDELLLVGCEALLSSGDVVAAEPLVRELADRSSDDGLAAWADCFQAQRWSLTDPDRLSEAADVADAAAGRLGELGVAAGVAKAHLVRAGCLARLGRVGECEAELDLALGAAREAGDRRRTVAVLGAAPLAALWGPSPVSRAGGRCLDVLRLLRITTASPAVETTSIRCQAVLEALRGRLDSAREKLEQSRATSRELGLRQGLFETELFAGFVEMWADAPDAAEPHLRSAYDGLGRLGIGADAGQAAALLARAVLARGDVASAGALAAEALDAAGQNLQTAVASRAALAEVRAAEGRLDEAATLVAEAIEIAERTDIVLEHALALQAAARVADAAGDASSASDSRARSNTLLSEKGITVESTVAPKREPLSEPTRTEHDLASPAGRFDRDQPGELPERDELAADRQQGWHVIEAAVRAWLDDDEAAWRRCYGIDFLGAGRERLSSQRSDLGLDEWAAASFDLRRQVTEIEVTGERVAQRGDHWFVSRNVGTADGDDIGFVFVSQVVDGRILSETIFDPSQLDEAIALADEGFDIENGLGEDHWIRDIRPAMYSVDPDLLERRFHDEYRLRDQRQMGWHDLTRDDLLDAIRANPDPFVVSVPMVWRSSESGMVVHRLEITADGSSVSGWIAVAEFRDQLVYRMDIYDEDDLDAALDHYADIAGSRVWRWNRSVHRRMVDGRLDGAAEAFTSDARFEVRRRRSPAFDGPISTLIDQHIGQWVDAGLDRVDAEMIEEHPDDRCVLRVTVVTSSGDRSTMLFLTELDDEGRCSRLAVFDADQIVDAIAELRPGASEVASPFHSSSHAHVDRVSMAIASGPIEAFAACFAPDFVVVDRRSMGLGTRGLEDLLESNTALIGNVLAWTAETIEMSDTASLTRVEVRSTVDESSWSMLLLTEYAGPGDDERIARWTQFDIDDRDSAIDAFRLLERLLEHSHLEEAERPEPNDASATAAAYIEAWIDRDADRMRALLADDFEHHGRDGVARLDVDASIEFALDEALFPDREGREFRVLSTRGEHLCLNVESERYAGETIVRYTVWESVDGRCRRIDRFGEDQFADASRRLDERHQELIAESEGRVPARLPEVTNEANEIVLRFLGARNQDDWDGALGALHPDLEVRTRRPGIDALGLSSRKSGAEWINGLRNAADSSSVISDVVQGAPKLLRREVIAVRGEVLVLARSVETIDGNEAPYLMLAESRDGQIVALTQWSHDQLEEAALELDRRWTEIGGGPLADYTHRWGVAYSTRDIAEVERLLAPTFETVDHRSIGLGRRDRAAFLETTKPILDVGAVFVMIRQIEVSDRCMLADAFAIVGDDLMFAVSITLIDGDGRCELIESFEITQLDAARRRFEELTSNVAPDDRGSPFDLTNRDADRPPLTNTAAQLVERMWSADERGDVDEMRRLLQPDFRSENRRATYAALAVPPGQYGGLVSRTGAHDERLSRGDLERLAERSILAIRGDDLAAGTGVADTDGYRMLFAGVAESVEGRLMWLCIWDETDMASALDELDRRWVERGGPAPLVEVMTEFRRLGREGDAAAVEAFVSPDLESADHRALGMGVRGHREWVESMTPLAGRCEFVMHEVLEHTDRMGLIRGTVSQADEGSWELLYLLRVDADGRVDRYEIFDWADVELAGSRFEELVTGSHPDPDADLDHDHLVGLTNNANRLGSQMIAAQARGDIDALDALLHPDFVRDERENTVSDGRLESRAEYLANFRMDSGSSDSSATQARSVVAVRGDDLCLSHLTVPRAGFGESLLMLVEADGLLIRRLCLWPQTQLHDAIEELDRRWVDRGGSELWSRFDRLFSSTFRDGTVEHLVEMVGPDFRSVDHRPLGLGERSPDEWLATAAELAGRATPMTHCALVRGNVRLARVSFTVNDDGSMLMDGLAIGVLDERGGYGRQELFDLDQWDACRERFEQLIAEQGDIAPRADNAGLDAELLVGLTNSADRLGLRMFDAQARGDIDEVDPLLHPDCVFEERSRAFAGLGGRLETKANYLADLRERIERVGGDVSVTTERSVIAVRGDDLCLSRDVATRDDIDRPSLALVEVARGLIRRLVVWDEDQLDDAVDELHRWWVERGGPSGWVGFDRHYRMAYGSGTVDDLAEIMAPDFVSIDARPLGLGERSRAELLDSTAPLLGKVRFVMQSATVQGRVVLGRVLVVHQGDGSVVNGGLCVGSWNEQWLQVRQELFDLDQWSDAQARFDELSS